MTSHWKLQRRTCGVTLERLQFGHHNKVLLTWAVNVLYGVRNFLCQCVSLRITAYGVCVERLCFQWCCVRVVIELFVLVNERNEHLN